jgi:hypothetical protein
MENTIGKNIKTKLMQDLGPKIQDSDSAATVFDTVKKIPSDLPESEKVEATGAASAGGYSAPLFGDMKEDEETKNTEKITKAETKEATGSSSAGAYVGPAVWAKSSTKKNWRGARKTQLPGGKFVEVKKKCQKFPYCNQGDIKALNIFENDRIKQVIKNISKKHNISENVIKNILRYELDVFRKYKK